MARRGVGPETESRRGVGPDTVTRRGAIMVIDQAGFTRKMLRRGAAFALRDVWKMRRLLIPLLRREHGEVFKLDADNLYVFFEHAAEAVNAAVAVHRAIGRSERRRTDPLAACIGIGFGNLLYVSSEDDYYGAEVNLAAKLGEDVAVAGDTLITVAAFQALSGQVEGAAGKVRYVTMSQVRVTYFPWLV